MNSWSLGHLEDIHIVEIGPVDDREEIHVCDGEMVAHQPGLRGETSFHVVKLPMYTARTRH